MKYLLIGGAAITFGKLDLMIWRRMKMGAGCAFFDGTWPILSGLQLLTYLQFTSDRIGAQDSTNPRASYTGGNYNRDF